MNLGNIGDSTKAVLDKLLSPPPPPAVLVVAPDRTRRERILKAVIDKHLPDAGKNLSGLALRRHKASALKIGDLSDLLDELAAPALFTPRRFCILEDTEALNAAMTKLLTSALPHLTADVCLLFSSSKALKTSAPYKFCSGAQSVIELSKLEGSAMGAWLKAELKGAGLKHFSEDLPQNLAAVCQGDLDLAAQMVEKLALFAEADSVSDEEFRQLFEEAPHHVEYELLDAISQSNPANAEVLLQQLVASGTNLFALLGLLARSFGQYLEVRRLAEQGRTQTEIQAQTKLSAWLVKKLSATARSYTTSELIEKLSLILEADSKLKNRSLGPDAVISDLLFKLAPARVVR